MDKVLICGDRNWGTRVEDGLTIVYQPEVDLIASWVCKLQDWGYDTIIEGEARGADIIARNLGKKMGFNIIAVPADWQKCGKSAGPIRNSEMLKHEPSLVLAFHSNIENSKGTKNMVHQATKSGIEVIIIKGV